MDKRPHPARYSKKLLPIFSSMIPIGSLVLDPFAGTGERLKELSEMVSGKFVGIEIEKEWIAVPEIVIQGNSLSLPFGDNIFDVVLTSVTYGNRMADHHEAKDNSIRNTYTHKLGKPLHHDNSGKMQWGEEYKQFHTNAIAESKRVLKKEGIFILNVKDHIRKGKRMQVTEWYKNMFFDLGFVLNKEVMCNLMGNGMGANKNVRVGYESVLLFKINT